MVKPRRNSSINRSLFRERLNTYRSEMECISIKETNHENPPPQLNKDNSESSMNTTKIDNTERNSAPPQIDTVVEECPRQPTLAQEITLSKTPVAPVQKRFQPLRYIKGYFNNRTELDNVDEDSSVVGCDNSTVESTLDASSMASTIDSSLNSSSTIDSSLNNGSIDGSYNSLASAQLDDSVKLDASEQLDASVTSLSTETSTDALDQSTASAQLDASVTSLSSMNADLNEDLLDRSAMSLPPQVSSYGFSDELDLSTCSLGRLERRTRSFLGRFTGTPMDDNTSLTNTLVEKRQAFSRFNQKIFLGRGGNSSDSGSALVDEDNFSVSTSTERASLAQIVQRVTRRFSPSQDDGIESGVLNASNNSMDNSGVLNQVHSDLNNSISSCNTSEDYTGMDESSIFFYNLDNSNPFELFRQEEEELLAATVSTSVCEETLPDIFDDSVFEMVDGLIMLIDDNKRYKALESKFFEISRRNLIQNLEDSISVRHLSSKEIGETDRDSISFRPSRRSSIGAGIGVAVGAPKCMRRNSMGGGFGCVSDHHKNFDMNSSNTSVATPNIEMHSCETSRAA